jgi:PPK2 family polyphosphate:nucleotide phosphotransferase
MDASGKDGTIRTVFTGVNPQGCRVQSFKAPTVTELDHDYLWRIHNVCPARGEIGIFNRSHYEDVVAVRVRKLAPEEVWRPRYEQICSFERLLTEEGTAVVKVFLHLSRDEQRRRLQERIDDPEKRWKFRPGDLDDRALWDDFASAYEDALHQTSTDWAPCRWLGWMIDRRARFRSAGWS